MDEGNTSLLKRSSIERVNFPNYSSTVKGHGQSGKFPSGWKRQWQLMERPGYPHRYVLKRAQLDIPCGAFTVTLYLQGSTRSVPWSINSIEENIDMGIDVREAVKANLHLIVSVMEEESSPVAQEQKLFQESFKKLLDQKLVSDVTIVTKDGELAAHWAVLATRSPFFRAMWENDCKEKRDNKIELNLTRETTEKMLKYIYSVEVDINTHEEGQALLAVADMYLIPGLKYEAELFLCSSITEETVFDLVLLSDMCKANFLKQAAFVYMHQNWKSVAGNAKIRDVLKHPELGTALFHFVCSENE